MIQAVAAVRITELEDKKNDSTMKQTEILSEQKLSVSSQDFRNFIRTKTDSQFTRFPQRLIICSPAKLRGFFFAFLALKKISNRVWNFCHAQMRIPRN
jgi:hypothetical protein